MRIVPTGLAVLCVLGYGSLALAQPPVREKAPTGKAAVFTAAELAAQLQEMDAKKIVTVRLLEGGPAFSFNILHRVGADVPQLHGTLVDLYIVKSGSATLVTGGTLVDAKPSPGREAGEMVGTAIRGGVTRKLNAGDTVYIPPGVPHCFTDGDIVYFNVHFPVKQDAAASTEQRRE